MGSEMFSEMSRRLAARGNRRTTVALVSSALAAWLSGTTDLVAKKKKKKKKKKKQEPQPAPGGCTPDVTSSTCANRCGAQTNNCGQAVDCGACGSCSGLKPDADLRAAVNATGTGATLTLCEGTWNVGMRVDVDRSMTIRGAGKGKTILDGNNLMQVLLVGTDAVVTLEDLTITRGRAYDGAGIYVFYGTLYLRNVEVSDSRASNEGGGIFSNNGTIELHEGTEIHDNTGYNGAGVLTGGGGFTMHGGSSITDNVATHIGGGISNFYVNMVFKSGSRISGNRAQLGGGISSYGGSSTLQSGSVVGGARAEDANVATVDGGGLHGSVFVLEAGSLVTGNEAQYGGGCYFGEGCTIRAGARVTGNRAPNGSGVSASPTNMVNVEQGAIVCDNVPLNDQCRRANANCPSTSDGVCPV
ncbi:MAG: hypothetical protein QM692_14390 [Thermomicrobiales bacterium]